MTRAMRACRYRNVRPPYPGSRFNLDELPGVAVVAPAGYPPEGWLWLCKQLDRAVFSLGHILVLCEGSSWWEKGNHVGIKFVMNWASHNWFPMRVHYVKEKRGARVDRMEERQRGMLAHSDYLVAIWDEVDPQVEQAIDIAKELKVKRKVITY